MVTELVRVAAFERDLVQGVRVVRGDGGQAALQHLARTAHAHALAAVVVHARPTAAHHPTCNTYPLHYTLHSSHLVHTTVPSTENTEQWSSWFLELLPTAEVSPMEGMVRRAFSAEGLLDSTHIEPKSLGLQNLKLKFFML